MENQEYNIELISNYLANQLSPEQRQEFEQQMSEDDELRNLVLNQQYVDQLFIEDKDWPETDFDSSNTAQKEYFDYYRNAENKAFYQELKEIESNKEEQNTKRRKGISYSIAAAIVSVLIVSALFLNKPTGFDYGQYSHYEHLPSATEKSGSNDDVLDQANLSFQERDFEQASKLYGQYFEVEEYTAKQESSSAQEPAYKESEDLAHIYFAISLAETDREQQAIEILQPIRENDNSLQQANAVWYSALFSLKQNNATEGKKYLQNYLALGANMPYQDDANQLLKKLK